MLPPPFGPKVFGKVRQGQVSETWIGYHRWPGQAGGIFVQLGGGLGIAGIQASAATLAGIKIWPVMHQPPCIWSLL